MIDMNQYKQLYAFLKVLKSKDWLVDCDDFDTLFKIYEWYAIVFKQTDTKLTRNEIELQLNHMVFKLTRLCNNKPPSNSIKLCTRCNKMRDKKEFKGKTSFNKNTRKYCLECRNKLLSKTRKVIEYLINTTINCSRCRKPFLYTEGFHTCPTCKEYQRLYRIRRHKNNN